MEGPYAYYLSHFMGGFMLSVLFGLPVAVVAAIGKELLDKYSGKGSPQLSAALITMAGGVLGHFARSVIQMGNHLQ